MTAFFIFSAGPGFLQNVRLSFGASLMDLGRPIELRRCPHCGIFGSEVTQGDECHLRSHCHNPTCGRTELVPKAQNAVITIPAGQVSIADDEQILGWVYGLGRRYIIGFTLVATNRRIVGADSGKQTLRLLFSLVATVMIWLIGFIVLVPYLLRINSLLPIAAFPALFLAIFLAGRLSKMDPRKFRTIELARDSISKIEYYKPGRTTEKSRFAIKTRKGSILRFWAAGKASHGMATTLLERFCTCAQPNIPILERKTRLISREDLGVILMLATVLGMALLGLLILRFYGR